MIGESFVHLMSASTHREYLTNRVDGFVYVRCYFFRYPLPRSETSRDIIERILEMTQEIAPPSVRDKRRATVEDIMPLIVEEGCGFRPSRKGGIRLESEVVTGKDGKKVVLVHNYG